MTQMTKWPLVLKEGGPTKAPAGSSTNPMPASTTEQYQFWPGKQQRRRDAIDGGVLVLSWYLTVQDTCFKKTSRVSIPLSSDEKSHRIIILSPCTVRTVTRKPMFFSERLQLDWTSFPDAQNINLPWDRDGYNKSETAYKKLLSRRIHWCGEENMFSFLESYS